MAKNLVIVESPAKAKTINKYLGKNYTVKASMGHVRDLVKSKLGVDLDKNFEPQYVNSRDKAKVIKELKEAAGRSEKVILALDPDREGEAIAWHLRELLKKEAGGEDRFSRVTYNQVTKPAILKAFSAPGELDMNKVEAQQARRILDRLVGYGVSPLLWRRIRGGSSAGRVQTVALRLVCEREKQVAAFEPVKYWVLGAKVARRTPPLEPFLVNLHQVDGKKADIKEEKVAGELLADLKQSTLVVDSVRVKEVKKRPQPPFITSTLQQAASSAYGFQPGRTMTLAQKLYEGIDLGRGEGATGLITYMRTDSVHLALEALEETRAAVKEVFGERYLPGKAQHYRSRGSAQEAHEAIRPTDPSLTPDSLKGLLDDAEWKLYSLIWKRTMACQMAPALLEQTTVDIGADSKAHRYLFRAGASKIMFLGYMKAWGRDLNEDGEGEESFLPPLEKEEALDVLEWLADEKETQPPRRYSEAGLIKALEENGVGRPSTYAAIVSTLYNRDYIQRENKSLKPTPAGTHVNDFLVERLPELFEVEFTARMEEELDRIEEGRVSRAEMMSRFYRRLEKWLDEAGASKIDGDELKALLELACAIGEFRPPVKIGKKTYDDQNFVREMREALENNREVTERQLDHLRRLVARYHEQIDLLTPEKAAELGVSELIEEEREKQKPPDDTTLLKLAMLEEVDFDPPRKIGKKTYDDREFARSLDEQVRSGKRLTDNQVRYLDRLVLKYAAQVENFEERAAAAVLLLEVEEDTESGPLLELLAGVKNFKEPTVRGKRTWDDAEFAESLRSQYAARRALTPRQRNALKKLLSRYHEQVPAYTEKQADLGLPAPGARGKGARGRGSGQENSEEANFDL